MSSWDGWGSLHGSVSTQSQTKSTPSRALFGLPQSRLLRVGLGDEDFRRSVFHNDINFGCRVSDDWRDVESLNGAVLSSDYDCLSGE
jgi:hypothetical protein